eukprot:5630990-Prymnesium_polylepis.1
MAHGAIGAAADTDGAGRARLATARHRWHRCVLVGAGLTRAALDAIEGVLAHAAEGTAVEAVRGGDGA